MRIKEITARALVHLPPHRLFLLMCLCWLLLVHWRTLERPSAQSLVLFSNLSVSSSLSLGSTGPWSCLLSLPFAPILISPCSGPSSKLPPARALLGLHHRLPCPSLALSYFAKPQTWLHPTLDLVSTGTCEPKCG